MDTDQEKPKDKLKKYLFGFVIVFYVSILIGSCWTPGCDIGQWFNQFYDYVFVNHHFLVLGFTRATPTVLMVFEVMWLLAYLLIITKIQHPYAGREYGDAKWGDAASFSSRFANHDSKFLVKVNFGDCPEPAKPVYVNTHNYWLGEGVFLNIDNKLTSNLNIEVIGPPGTGKSFRIVRPILSQLSGSFLVTDPKGEISQQTGQYMEDNGYGVFILNAESEAGMKNSNHFNPFLYIETESDILSLCEILFKATKCENAQSGDQFFEDMAQILMVSLFYLMHYTYPRSKKTWKEFVKLLESTTVRTNAQGMVDNSDPNGIMQIFIRANDKWKEEHNGEPLKGFVDVEKIYSNAPETASSIVSSLDSHAKYMKLDCVVDLLSDDDLDFINTFGYGKKSHKSPTGKYVLYIITSENVRYFDWIVSMVYSLFIEKLYSLTANDPSLHQTLPNHLTFLMDEFSNVTLPKSFVDLTSTMRSRGISVVAIIQNLYQLESKFSQKNQDKNLRANFATTVILGGPKDMENCKTLAEEIGKRTIHKQTQGLTRGGQGSSSENEDVMERYLEMPQDIKNMPKDGPCIINVTGTDPLKVNKIQFQNSPLCPLLTRKVPYKVKRTGVLKSKPYDYDKPAIDQLPDFLCGKAADEYLKKCEEDGVKVIHLTETDLDAYAVLSSAGEKAPGKDASTEEFWKQIRINSARIIEEKKKKALNLDSFSGEGLLVVQQLRNNDFAADQINALSSLIRKGFSFDNIVKYFNNKMPAADIEAFVNRLQVMNVQTGGN